MSDLTALGYREFKSDSSTELLQQAQVKELHSYDRSNINLKVAGLGIKIEYFQVKVTVLKREAYDSVRRELLYNILIEFGIPRKLVGIIKMCLNETNSTVHIGIYQSDKFPIQNGL
jgi:hypothetical protein